MQCFILPICGGCFSRHGQHYPYDPWVWVLPSPSTMLLDSSNFLWFCRFDSTLSWSAKVLFVLPILFPSSNGCDFLSSLEDLFASIAIFLDSRKPSHQARAYSDSISSFEIRLWTITFNNSVPQIPVQHYSLSSTLELEANMVQLHHAISHTAAPVTSLRQFPPRPINPLAYATHMILYGPGTSRGDAIILGCDVSLFVFLLGFFGFLCRYCLGSHWYSECFKKPASSFTSQGRKRSRRRRVKGEY